MKDLCDDQVHRSFPETVTEIQMFYDFYDARRRNSYTKNSLEKSEFRKNWLSDSHVLLEGVNLHLPALSTFLGRFR